MYVRRTSILAGFAIVAALTLAACGPAPQYAPVADAASGVPQVPVNNSGIDTSSALLGAGAGYLAGSLMNRPSGTPSYSAPPAVYQRPTTVINKTIVQKNVTVVRPRPSYSAPRSFSSRRR